MNFLTRFVVAIVAANGLAAQDSLSNLDRVARWRDDLQAFGDTMHGAKTKFTSSIKNGGQRDLVKLYPNLDIDIAALSRAIPNRTDSEIAMSLMKLMAAPHVGHNAVYPLPGPELPITLEWLAEGLVITSAAPEYGKAIGARLLRIGDANVTDLARNLEQYVSYETEPYKQARVAATLTRQSILEIYGLVKDGEAVLFIEGPSGAVTVPVRFQPAGAEQVSLSDVFGGEPPLAQSMPGERYYWSQYVADSNSFYIQYNRCQNDPAQPFAEFADRVLHEIDQKRPRRVIVDLRFNSGGETRVIYPLVDGLAKRRGFIGVPYVLIGPRTFSAAVQAADRLRKTARAVLVGTPTGGILGGYGRAPARRLPNSNLPMQWTIDNFGRIEQLLPQLEVIPTISDFRQRRDSTLEAAISAR